MSSAVMASGQTMVVPVWTSGSHLNPELFARAFVDLEDWALVEPHRWYARKCGDHYYAYAHVGSRITSMHRLVMNAQPGEEIDHIDHRTMNNRRKNLRVVTRSQNNCNRRPTGGVMFKGVFLCRGKYRTSYWQPLKQRHKFLGDYTDAEKAARAWDAEARADGRHEFELNFPAPTESN